jgi:hypothetical protein
MDESLIEPMEERTKITLKKIDKILRELKTYPQVREIAIATTKIQEASLWLKELERINKGDNIEHE